jgi:hypothetical protein
MTRAEWDEAWLKEFNAIYRHGVELARARETAFAVTIGKHGLRPEEQKEAKEPRPSLLTRIAVSLARRRIESAVRGLPPLQVGGVMVKNIVLAVVYGVGASYLVVQAALADGVVSAGEWSAIFGAFFAAAWGKFSQPDRPVSAKPTE